MTRKPVIRLRRAHADIAAAIAHYRTTADVAVAIRFIDELERSISMIAKAPATGSPRYAELLDLPGLRCRRLAGYPYLVFYAERERQIDVWRVLHERRDILGSLTAP